MLDVMRNPPPVLTGVQWTACRVRKPDADRTVLMYHPELDDEPVGVGWWDGEVWRAAESGGSLGSDCVQWWADYPEPPAEPRPTDLWCVHIEGPDDMIPAPSKHEATAACWLLNAAFARMAANQASDEPLVRAKVAEWPYGAAEHKADQHHFHSLLGTELQVGW